MVSSGSLNLDFSKFELTFALLRIHYCLAISFPPPVHIFVWVLNISYSKFRTMLTTLGTSEMIKTLLFGHSFGGTSRFNHGYLVVVSPHLEKQLKEIKYLWEENYKFFG